MEKRGNTETLWMLVSIIGAVLIAYVVASIGSGYATGNVFLKSRVAKELAFEINALYSVPGDVYIINENRYNFSFKFDEDKVKVFEHFGDLVGTASYYFVKSGDEGIRYNFTKPKQIVVSKIDNKIRITEEIPDFFVGVIKKEPDFKNKKILLFYEISDIQSRDLVEVIIKVLNSKKIFPNLYSSYNKDEIKYSDVILGVYSKKDGKTLLYINKKSLKNQESLSLANALSNKISNVIETEIISLEEIDEDKKDILDNDKIAIYIEFPETNKIVEIANAVYDSLGVYS